MPRLLILWQKDSRPSTQFDNNPSIMAICLLESGHDWTINRSSRRIQSCAGSSRQVHQVDRVQAHCHRVVDFISDIIHRFDFPHTIITDLGSNFTSQSFWDFCYNSCIEVKYASVAHPRANIQVERINGLVLDGLKKRLYDANTKKGGK